MTKLLIILAVIVLLVALGVALVALEAWVLTLIVALIGYAITFKVAVGVVLLLNFVAAAFRGRSA